MKLSYLTFFLFIMSSIYGSAKLGAHRGCDIFSPENTLAGIKYVYEAGAKAIEIDCQWTKDGHIILMHDATVDRTTNGCGIVNEMTLEEIRELDAGGKLSKKFLGEKVPLLSEVLKYCKSHDIEVCIEPKRKLDGLAKAINELIDELEVHNIVRIYSFDRKIIDDFIAIEPAYPIHYSLKRVTEEDVDQASKDKISLTADFTHVDKHLLKKAKQSGVLIHLWTVNHLNDYQFFDGMGAEFILTDTLLTLHDNSKKQYE